MVLLNSAFFFIVFTSLQNNCGSGFYWGVFFKILKGLNFLPGNIQLKAFPTFNFNIGYSFLLWKFLRVIAKFTPLHKWVS